MAAWQDRYWTSRDGLQLHYRDYAGPADRPPILCLHGLTRNARDFENLADRLAGKWQVIAVDFRGRGLSEHDPLPSRYMPPTYAADVLQHPLQVEDRFHFPGNPMITRAELPEKWESWRRFWGS